MTARRHPHPRSHDILAEARSAIVAAVTACAASALAVFAGVVAWALIRHGGLGG